MARKSVILAVLMFAVVSAAGAMLWFVPAAEDERSQQVPIATAPPEPEPAEAENTADLQLRGPVEQDDDTEPPAESVFEDRSVRNVTPEGITRSRQVTGPLKRIKSAIRKPDRPKRKRKQAVRRPVIEAAGYIENARKQRFVFANIQALEKDATCTLESGAEWPCGASARTALRRLVRGRTVQCTAQESEKSETDAAETTEPADAEPVFFNCRIGNVQVDRWLVAYGWARPTDAADEAFAKLEETARAQKRGQWRAIEPKPLRDQFVAGTSGDLSRELGTAGLELPEGDGSEPFVDPFAVPADDLPFDTVDPDQGDGEPPSEISGDLDWREPDLLGELR